MGREMEKKIDTTLLHLGYMDGIGKFSWLQVIVGRNTEIGGQTLHERIDKDDK